MDYTLADLAAMNPIRRAERQARDAAALDELARSIRACSGVGLKALDNATQNKAHIGAETLDRLVVEKALNRLLQRHKARIRAKEFRAAQRGGKGEAEGTPAGFGQPVKVVVFVAHGSSVEIRTVAGAAC